MVKQLNSVEAFREFIHQYPLAVVHVMRDQCSVCHAVLPQIEDLMQSYPNVPLAVINQRIKYFHCTCGFNFYEWKRNASSRAFYRYATF